MSDTYDVTNPSKPTITKDPDAILDYTWDWTAYLADISDSIDTETVTVETGLTVVSDTINGGKVVAFISGGTAGETLSATCEIVTAAGRTDDRTIYLKIKER